MDDNDAKDLGGRVCAHRDSMEGRLEHHQDLMEEALSQHTEVGGRRLRSAVRATSRAIGSASELIGRHTPPAVARTVDGLASRARAALEEDAPGSSR